MRRKQCLEIIKTALVPNNWNGDKNIIGKVVLEGIRGIQYKGFLFKDLKISVI